MSDIVERLSGWENKGHEGDPMVDMLLDDTSLALAEIRRLQAELAVARQELAEAKIAIGWARDAGLEEAAKIAEAQPFFPDTHTGIRQQWVKDQIAASIRGLAAASKTEEAKER